MSNKVLKKIVYLIEASLASPLCVSNGEEEVTDKDVIKNSKGTPFIPGSSLAGAMRAYIDKSDRENCIFGYGDVNEKEHGNPGAVKEEYQYGRMSSVYVSDFTFSGDTAVRIRDSVRLSSRKTADTEHKFDMEVIDTGAKGYFYMEMVIRSKDDEKKMLDEMRQVLSGWKREDIRLGAKKTRGYGELKIDSAKKKVFDASNILEYANVYQYEKKDALFTEGSILDTLDESDLPVKYITIQLPLRQEGGISIRQYGVEKEKPDFTHITANGEAVIPGTSMAGAIRHRIELLLTQLEVQNVKEIIDAIFGFVDASRKDIKASKSSIIVSECILEGAKPITMIRNGVSRFESGTKDGALFKETTYVGGTTILKIKVEQCEEALAIIGFLLLALKDLANGYLAVGGQTSVGRGLFKENGQIKITGIETSEEACFREASYRLERKRGVRSC